jgi:hypothetical protein
MLLVKEPRQVHHMVNFSVIQVKVVAPEKPLDVNTFPKIPWCWLYCLRCLKISLCWYGHLWYPKILCVDFRSNRTIGQNQLNVDLNLKPTPLSPSTYILSLSRQSAISLSLFLCFLPKSPLCIPVLIAHKNHMSFEYDHHLLIDNKCLRTHLLFHLYLEYNNLLEFFVTIFGVFPGKTALNFAHVNYSSCHLLYIGASSGGWTRTPDLGVVRRVFCHCAGVDGHVNCPLVC